MGCCGALLDIVVQLQGGQPGLIQGGRLDGYETISGFQVPLAVDEQVVAALHLQGEAAQVNDPHGEVQLDVLITPPPLVIDEALAVAAGQGFVDPSFRTPLWLLAAGCGEYSWVHSHGRQCSFPWSLRDRIT